MILYYKRLGISTLKINQINVNSVKLPINDAFPT